MQQHVPSLCCGPPAAFIASFPLTPSSTHRLLSAQNQHLRALFYTGSSLGLYDASLHPWNASQTVASAFYPADPLASRNGTASPLLSSVLRTSTRVPSIWLALSFLELVCIVHQLWANPGQEFHLQGIHSSGGEKTQAELILLEGSSSKYCKGHKVTSGRKQPSRST